MLFAVLATGPSMRLETARAVMGRCSVVAVSDAYRLAPWADAIVSTDFSWWRRHPKAQDCSGRKFSGMVDYQKVDGVERMVGENATNSGLLGVKVAIELGAKKVLLCGFDMHSPGSHFFGLHPKELRSTTRDRMEQFKKQFTEFRAPGVEIVNCTPGSHLKCFRLGDLACELG